MDQNLEPAPLYQTTQSFPQATSKTKLWMLTFFLTVILIVLLVILLYMLMNKPTQQPKISNDKSNALIAATEQSEPNPQPSPFEFEEMTIPYIRQKTFTSNLDQLTEYQNAAGYTSYLTSYISEGLKINGLLTIPKGEKPEKGFPAIVFVHGYIPPNQYRTTEKYVDYVNYLARSGYVVFKIDLRGHGDSEGEPGGGYYSGDYISDVLHARAALQNADDVNKDKIGLWGHSMAGNVLLRSMAAKTDIPAIVIWGGAVYTYTDMADYGIQDASYQPQPTDTERQRKRQRMRDLYGNADPNHWFWKQVIPTNYLSDIKGAIQLNHAVNDDVVSIEYSRNLAKLLTQTQIPFELKEYPSGGHNITNPSFTPAMQNTVAFFDKYLKD